MTGVTVKLVDVGRDDEAAPPGTAIVRPLRHVLAVRERHARRFADPGKAAASRSARAWGWALGESAIAPVTDRPTPVPPSRSDIEAEITAADEKRLRGDRENRADAAATVLRWLIGEDDSVPVRGENRGELVGGFGDVVRSPEQVAGVLALAAEGRRQAVAEGGDVDAGPDDRQFARQDADYLDGVVGTLAWVLGQRSEAPITRVRSRELTTADLKSERVHAEDAIEQARNPWIADRLPSAWYGEGVKYSIAWLLGDSIAPPVDPTGRGPYCEGSELPNDAQRCSGQAAPDLNDATGLTSENEEADRLPFTRDHRNLGRVKEEDERR